MRASGRKKSTDTGPDTDARAPAPRTPFEVIEYVLWQPRRTAPPPVFDNDPGTNWERHRPTPEEEEGFGRIRGFQRQGGNLAPTNHHRGSAASWIAVGLASVGFGLGGLALVQGGMPVLLITAGVLIVAGLVVAIACDILTDVVLDPPRVESEEPHDTPLHKIKREHPYRI